YARIVWPFLPVEARRVAFDFHLAVPDGPGRRLIEHCAILGTIDHPFPGFPGCRCRGGLEIDGLAREKRLDIGTSHVRGEHQGGQASDTSCGDNGTCNCMHDYDTPLNE